MSFALLEAYPMPDLDSIRSEIQRMRGQIGRQRREILQLQRAGIATASAETAEPNARQR